MSRNGKIVGSLALFSLLLAGSWSTGRGQETGTKEPNGKLPEAAVEALATEAFVRDKRAEPAIRAALEGPTVIEFVETPLSDVVDYLKDYHKIEIQLDIKALDEAGIGSDVPITRNLRGISLAAAIKLLLKPLDMTAVYDDEVLLLTTVGEAGRMMRTRIYDVTDLLEQDRLDRARLGQQGAAWDYEPLVTFIQTVVAPKTWKETGGPGSIAKHFGLLAVDQTDRVHDQLEAFLVDTRRAIKARAALPAIEPRK